MSYLCVVDDSPRSNANNAVQQPYSCGELSIGLSCACLPSVNLIVQDLKVKWTAWKMKWNPPTPKSSTNHTGQTCPHCAARRAQLSSSNLDIGYFERELAMWTGGRDQAVRDSEAVRDQAAQGSRPSMEIAAVPGQTHGEKVKASTGIAERLETEPKIP